MIAHITSRRNENIGASPTSDVKAYQPKIATIHKRGAKISENDRSFAMKRMKLKSKTIAVNWFSRLEPAAMAEPV